jgi:Spy/CpxP family protein refolding chaperone
MKRNWLLYLVIFSLALNVGTIGSFAYLRYQDHSQAAKQELPGPMPIKDLWLALNMDPEQRQALRSLLPDHRRRVLNARQELAKKRQELFGLVKGEPSWSAIQAKVQEISVLQGGLEEEVVRFLLEVKKQLKPEQHAAFVDLVQQRLERSLVSMGRACGPGGPPFGHGRGMGMRPGPKGPGPMGPGGPHGPPGPPPEFPK